MKLSRWSSPGNQVGPRRSQFPLETAGVDLPALTAASITVVLWASAFVAIRSSAAYFDPGPLALGRLVAGVLVLGAVLVHQREGLPPRAAWPGIMGSGVLWFGAYMVVLNWGEQQVDAGTAAMIVNVGPIMIALLGGWLLNEGFPTKLLTGIGVSFVGAIVVGLSMTGKGGSSRAGVALCMLAAIAYAGGVVSQKPALRFASPVQVTTFGCLIGALLCTPFAGQLVTQTRQAPVSATLNMVYLGVFPTAVAFSTYAFALSRTTAGRMGATTYAVPALVVLMSWIFLGEVPGWLTLLGGLLCLSGVAVSRGSGRPGSRPVPPSAATDLARAHQDH